jgi:uncharacterized membrane protein YebE (DUF533 family)
MFDVERLLGNMLGGSVLGKAAKSMGGGLSSVNGGMGGTLGKGALGIGALGVAWAAFEHFQEQNKNAAAGANAGSPPPPPGSSATPPPPPGAVLAPPPMATATAAVTDTREADAVHLIRAMIAAANADGQIDAEERSRVLERALTAGLHPQTQQFLLAELNAPATMVSIVAQTREGLKRETLGASIMAITEDTEVEKRYLDQLAAGLGLTAEDAKQVRTLLAG